MNHKNFYKQNSQYHVRIDNKQNRMHNANLYKQIGL
jgi:hypothetical protein